MARESTNHKYRGILVAGLLGVIAGIVIDPKVREQVNRIVTKQVRAAIARSVKNYFHSAKERISNLKDSVGPLKDKVSTGTAHLRDTLSEKTSALKKQTAAINRAIADRHPGRAG